ncbi:MAG: hypothetical protein IJM44_07800 [Ruminococcus sp.]|nr:hypothetical protein [Ruminococcus sp.]
MYTKGSKNLRLIIGIISIVLSLVVLFQSCAAGAANALSENGESSGTAGALLAIIMLISGIISIAARKSKGGIVTSAVFYILGGVLAFSSAGSFSDLKIWAVVAFIFAALLMISLKMKKKDEDPAQKEKE